MIDTGCTFTTVDSDIARKMKTLGSLGVQLEDSFLGTMTNSKTLLMTLILLLASGAFAANKVSLSLQHPATVNGTQLKPGDYKIEWDGTGNAVELRIDGRWKTDFPNAKVLVAQLKPGDAFKIRSGGGGGYGDPLQRAIELVQEDVRRRPTIHIGLTAEQHVGLTSNGA